MWNYSNTLDVNTYASYLDFDFSPSYSCDKNVLVEVIIHRGIGRYSPIVGRQYGHTVQYGSSVRKSLRIPSCRYIPRFGSQSYTVEVNAVAPDGTEWQVTRYVTRSPAPSADLVMAAATIGLCADVAGAAVFVTLTMPVSAVRQ